MSLPPNKSDDAQKNEAINPRERLLKINHRIPETHLKGKIFKDSEGGNSNTTAGKDHRSDFISVKMMLHQRLLEELNAKGLLANQNEETLKNAVRSFVSSVVENENIPINSGERERMAEELSEETLGVGPLAPLMADPAITDVLVNGFDKVYVERFGRLEKTDIRFADNDHLVRLIQRIVARVGRRIDASSPLVDARLPDGSRVNASLPPLSVDGPTLSIRRFGRHRLSVKDLVHLGSISPAMAEFLSFAIKGKQNIAISGGTGAGKSTLLGALSEAISFDERIITIEDTVELVLDQEHVVRFETRPVNIEGQGMITARDLVRNALRMRPNRIIVGEVRGGEAMDMLQSMNTGHEGGLTTLHANSPRDALARLESMVLMAGAELPARAIREQFVSALNLLVHIQRYEDGIRRVNSIVEIVGMEENTPQTQEIFKFEARGKNGRMVEGIYRPTGIIPRCVEALKRKGLQIPIEIFHPASGAEHG